MSDAACHCRPTRANSVEADEPVRRFFPQRGRHWSPHPFPHLRGPLRLQSRRPFDCPFDRAPLDSAFVY